MSAGAEAAGASGADEAAEGRSLAEWVSFGVAAAILGVVAGLVAYLWWSAPGTDPVLAVAQTGAVRQAGGQYYVPFEVTNSGGLTAEAVVVRGELLVGGKAVEELEVEFSFLSGGEVEQGAFIFTRDPRAGELRLRAGSYSLP